MSRDVPLLLLAHAVCIVTGACRRSQDGPKVTIADSQRLIVNWENAFVGCDSNLVQDVVLKISGRFPIKLKFDDKETKVGADPCLTHSSIEVKLKYEGGEVWSHISKYNFFNSDIKIDELYSGLLQKHVVDKTCLKKDRELFVPDIPDELSNCVLDLIHTDESDRVNPVQFYHC